MKKEKLRKPADKRILSITLGILFLSGFISPMAFGRSVDVYLIYAGKNKKAKNKLVRALLNGYSLKTYNVDLLAIADYSGKQKALAKFASAKLVVILLDAPIEILKGAHLPGNVLIIRSVKTTVTSEKRRLYVVHKNVDVSHLGENVKKLEVSQKEDLADRKKIASVEVISVDDSTMDINTIVSLIVKKILGS